MARIQLYWAGGLGAAAQVSAIGVALVFAPAFAPGAAVALPFVPATEAVDVAIGPLPRWPGGVPTLAGLLQLPPVPPELRRRGGRTLAMLPLLLLQNRGASSGSRCS